MVATLAPTRIGRFCLHKGKVLRLCDNGRHIEVPHGLAVELGILSGPAAATPLATTPIPRQRPTSLAAWLRSPPAAGASIILGFASVWRQQYVSEQGLECMEAGAFAGVLRGGHDISALISHSWSKCVASSDRGNLFLAEDDLGLLCAVAVRPGLDHGLVERIRLSRLRGMSIAYRTIMDDRKPRWRGRGISPSVVTGRTISEVSFTGEGANPAACCLVAKDERGRLVVPSQTERIPELRRLALARLIELSWSCSPSSK